MGRGWRRWEREGAGGGQSGRVPPLASPSTRAARRVQTHGRARHRGARRCTRRGGSLARALGGIGPGAQGGGGVPQVAVGSIPVPLPPAHRPERKAPRSIWTRKSRRGLGMPGSGARSANCGNGSTSRLPKLYRFGPHHGAPWRPRLPARRGPLQAGVRPRSPASPRWQAPSLRAPLGGGGQSTRLSAP